MFKYPICALLVIISAYLSGRYKAMLDRRLVIYRALCELVSELKDGLCSSMAPLRTIAVGTRNDTLLELGFYSALERGESLFDAVAVCFSEGEHDVAFRDKVYKVFSPSGEERYDTERDKLTEGAAALEERLGALREEYAKKTKIVGTLAVAVTVGVIILFL